jgi:hypothetical protein
VTGRRTRHCRSQRRRDRRHARAGDCRPRGRGDTFVGRAADHRGTPPERSAPGAAHRAHRQTGRDVRVALGRSRTIALRPPGVTRPRPVVTRDHPGSQAPCGLATIRPASGREWLRGRLGQDWARTCPPASEGPATASPPEHTRLARTTPPVAPLARGQSHQDSPRPPGAFRHPPPATRRTHTRRARTTPAGCGLPQERPEKRALPVRPAPGRAGAATLPSPQRAAPRRWSARGHGPRRSELHGRAAS